MADKQQPSSNDNVKELKDSFEQQQAMIGELRDALKQKETSKMKQDKNMEDYATRLAKMKPRLMKGKGRGRVKEREELAIRREIRSISTESTSVDQTLSSSSKILNPEDTEEGKKAVVESTSQSIEASPKESSDHPDVEQSKTGAETGNRARILQLRKQVEENKRKFERQQRDNADKRAAMEDMKEMIDNMKTEIQNRDSVIQSLKDEDSLPLTDVNMQHLYQQVLQKDNCLFDLTDKVQQLESILQDQKEQLDEKDQVIAARTEAVSLIARDRDEKMLSTVQELEEVRMAMREMQTNFTKKEETWVDKEKTLTIKIEEQAKKLGVFDENCQRIENIRFELSARNAELQEKIVTMQSERKNLHTELSSLKSHSDEKNKEILELKSKLSRAESFGQKKLKALEKQLKNISKDSDVGEKLLALENKIAELEEEKGNLQLKLIDFDDVKTSSNELKTVIKTLEDKLDQMNEELLSQMSSISSLENEKINLVENLNSKSLIFTTHEEQLTDLKIVNEQLLQSNVTLKLRVCALEEERDVAIKNQEDLTSSIAPAENLDEINSKLQLQINSLEEQLSETNQKLKDLENVCIEKENITQLALEEKESKVKENQCLISMLAEKENYLTAQAISFEKHILDKNKLDQEIHLRDDEIQQKVLTSIELENRIENLNQEIADYADMAENLKKTISNLEEDLVVSNTKINNLKEAEKNLSSVLVEKEKTILILEGEVCSTNDEVSKKAAVVDNQIKKLEELENLLKSREAELVDLEINYKNRNEEQLINDANYKKLEQDIINSQKCLKETEAKLTSECEILSCLLADKDNQVVTLEHKLQVKSQEIANNQIMISKFETELCEVNKLYDNLVLENQSVIEKMSSMKNELDNANAVVETYGSESNNYKETLNQNAYLIEHLQGEKVEHLEKLQLMQENSEVLNHKVSELEKEINELNSSLTTKDNSYLQLQMEFQSVMCSKEEEIAYMKQVFDDKEMEISSLKDSLTNKDNLNLLEALRTDVEVKSQNIAQLEQSSNQSVAEYLSNIEAKTQVIQGMEHDIGNLHNEITQLKFTKDQHNENLVEATSQIEKLKIELDAIKESKQLLEDSLEALKKEVDEKNSFIINLQTELENYASNKFEQTSNTVENLQIQLSESASHSSQLSQYYEEKLLEESKVNCSLKEELDQLKQLQHDVTQELQLNCNQITQKLKEQEEEAVKIQSVADTNLREAQIKIEELENLTRNLNSKIQEKEELLESVQKKSVSDSFESSRNFFDQLGSTEVHSSSSDESLKKENENLKEQLNSAQQAIVRLETSLATQAELQSDSSADTVESWGVVDLGEPSVSGPNSMTTSLIEKDKTLTVIQEQLKEALEQVSTVSDAKKLVQHQMNTLEAELNHSKNKIFELEKQLAIADQKIENLSKETALTELKEEPQFIQQRVHEAFAASSIDPQESAVSSGAQPVATDTDPSSFFDKLETKKDDERQFESQCIATPSVESASFFEQNEPENTALVQELQFKLSWYEENWASWTNHCEQLQVNIQAAEQQIQSLNQQVEGFATLQTEYNELQQKQESLLQDNTNLQVLLQEAQEKHTKLEEANEELDRLRQFETQVYELQSQVQTMEHQISLLESKVAESSQDSAKLHEYEVLYGELQTSMIEAETKREGSKSRVQELELMVQSAETEILRLRTEITTLTESNKTIETELITLREEFNNQKEEFRKSSLDKQTFEEETSRLQKEASALHSHNVELQSEIERKSSETAQQASEIEVLMGDNDRFRSSYEILESEHNRLRAEGDVLTQNIQMLTAQNESLETEIQRLQSFNQSLSLDSDHTRGEVQRLSDVGTSAESEISRLQMEVNNLSAMNIQYQEMEKQFLDMQKKQLTQKDIQLEELDWNTEGQMEAEHLQRSSSVERNLLDEIDQIKQKSIELEREKNQITDDLEALKLKNSKIVQKLKAANHKNENLMKKMNDLKKGGLPDLNQALEEEMKSQIQKSEKERDEIKVKLEEAEKEKAKLIQKLGVFEDAHDKYVEIKELQDATMRQMSVSNKNLESQVATLEWKLSEMEENYEEQIRNLVTSEDATNVPVSQPQKDSSDDSEIAILKQSLVDQEQQIMELTNHKLDLETTIANLDSKVEDLSMDNDKLQALLNNVNESKRKSDSDVVNYKSSFMDLHKEHENLKDDMTKKSEEMTELQETGLRLKSGYDSLYEQYVQMQDEKDTYKYENGLLVGERDKLQELSNSLNNQLEALREEEVDDIITGLQDECSELRDQNSNLKDEVTKLVENIKISEESNEQLRDYFDKHIEEADCVRQTFHETSRINKDYEATLEKQSKEIMYLTAEIASLKKKSTQQNEALVEMESQTLKWKDQLEIVNLQNNELKAQVHIADMSLAKLASTDQDYIESSPGNHKNELEAALMSLHLRDLRCQHLSLEINKLLEERDTLQLKFSASLRQNQDFNRELSQSQQLAAPTTPPPSLNRKLAELRELNSDLEEKALSRFNSPQGTMPPTFPTFISHTAPTTPTATRHSDHTVTRENRGSSGTLMDWIMGKSPSKEVLHV